MRSTFLSLLATAALSQGQIGPVPSELGASPQAVGEPGIMWYTTWDTALAEAQRSNRPIFFMAAAATCNGISGVFWPGYTRTQNSLFSEKKFVAASRDFVCVRLESYESKEHQDLIRTFLRGAFANTAFCVLAPDGKERLSGSGRSPSALFGRRGGDADLDPVVKALTAISQKYRAKGGRDKAVVQDFHSARQALNVASGDQRLLVLTVADESSRSEAGKVVQAVLNDSELVGVFHHDFVDLEEDEEWRRMVSEEKKDKGFVVIRADEFGMEGEVVAQLPVTATSAQLKVALLKANKDFAASEKRKVYSEHVREGRRERVYFEGGMPYGEDRDGDGKIDERRGRRGRR